MTFFDATQSHLDRLQSAFASLEQQGYKTLFGEVCCGGCSAAELAYRNGGDMPTQCAFFSEQTLHNHFNRSGTQFAPAYISWAGEAATIRSVLEAHGFQTEHNGSDDASICITPTDGLATRNRFDTWEEDEEEWEEDEEEWEDEDE